jgi:ribosomal-protein-alanine N-acetyltransferase
MASPPPRAIPELAQLSLVVETPRLRLRPMVLADVDDLYAFTSNAELPRMMSWNAHTDRRQTHDWVRGNIDELAQGTCVAWTIVHGDRPSGCISLDGITWEFRAWRIDRAELGYWLAPPLWGKGLMSEAALAATRWGFETLGLHKITIGCVEGNLASQKIIERLGYRFLALFEEDFWRDGRWQHHRRYEMTAAEWSDAARTLRFNKPRPAP